MTDQRTILPGAKLPLATTDDIGATNRPLIEGPCSFERLYCDGGGYWEYVIKDCRGNAVCFCPCSDGSLGDEAHRSDLALVQFVADALNEKAARA